MIHITYSLRGEGIAQEMILKQIAHSSSEPKNPRKKEFF